MRWAVTVLVVITLLVGCRKTEETATGQAAGTDSKGTSEKMTIQTEEGTVTVEQGGGRTTITGADGSTGTITASETEVPKGFPLALMPKSVIQQSTHISPADQPEAFHLETTVAASVADAAAFYEKELKSKGLTVQRVATQGEDRNEVILSGQSDETQGVAVIERNSEDKLTRVSLNWTRTK
ncbi:MAG: hypothetical protein GXY55_05395 [Phycisphaerae bacterium]|nr:hypothetical protein [Phycisphaerae bacterium]